MATADAGRHGTPSPPCGPSWPPTSLAPCCTRTLSPSRQAHPAGCDWRPPTSWRKALTPAPGGRSSQGLTRKAPHHRSTCSHPPGLAAGRRHGPVGHQQRDHLAPHRSGLAGTDRWDLLAAAGGISDREATATAAAKATGRPPGSSSPARVARRPPKATANVTDPDSRFLHTARAPCRATTPRRSPPASR